MPVEEPVNRAGAQPPRTRTCTRRSARACSGAARGFEVRISLSNRLGRVLIFRMATPGVPNVDFKCQAPGAKAVDC